MRTGGYAVQQALGAEAAGAVRQAASLARRRGHAQVTPLHVAIAVLSAATTSPGGGLLRAACLRSHPDPHRCEALEVCLGAALRRLPVAWTWPAGAAAAASRHGSQGQHGIIHHGHHAAPPAALSNALVAALKRAQAHQRRGTGGTDGGLQQGHRQQPAAAAAALAGKVELDQLVVSILDDPSVDRAMREAGFSSSQVKANVENSAAASLLEKSHSPSSDTTCANPVHKKIRVGAGQRYASLEVQHRPVVGTEGRSQLALSLISCHSSGDQADQAISRTGRPASIGGTTTATASLPPWLRRRSQHPTLTESTHCNLNLQATCHRPKFTELTAENLKVLCNALEQRVPLHHNGVDVPGIASTVLQCRSGMMRRARRAPTSSATWLLFHGKGVHNKTAIAQELAKLVFGSYADFTSVVNTSGELTLQIRKKPRDVDENGYVGTRLFEAILENPHRVIWIDGIDQMDHASEIAIRNVIAKGRIVGCNGGVVNLEDTIIVMSSQALDSTCFASSTPRMNRQIDQQNYEEYVMQKGVKSRRLGLDLNACSEADEDEGDSSSDDDLGIMNVADGVFCFD